MRTASLFEEIVEAAPSRNIGKLHHLCDALVSNSGGLSVLTFESLAYDTAPARSLSIGSGGGDVFVFDNARWSAQFCVARSKVPRT